MKELAVRFGAAGTLIGVVTEPTDTTRSASRPTILLLGAGLVHRVGPHRLYVKLARELAREGFTAMRFDFSGIGDSGPRHDSMPLERSAVGETREAMDWLTATGRGDRFVLMAICSGAGFSFRTACADPRVIGVSLINAAGHRWGTNQELSRTLVRHYLRMLVSPAFRRKNWRKLLRFDFDRGPIGRAVMHRLRRLLRPGTREVALPPEADRIASGFAALLDRGVRVQILYSEGDEGWDYYQLFLRDRLRNLKGPRSLELGVVPGANHTFTLLAHQRELIHRLTQWTRAYG